MAAPFKPVSGSILAPRGFWAAGVFCDIKRLGTGKGSDKGQKPDLALIVSEVPAAVAGLFTTNQIQAAPVKVCLPRVRKGTAQAIVVNSGNANACTGRRGLEDAFAMCERVAASLKPKSLQAQTKPGPGRTLNLARPVPSESVLVGSTGRIGVPLPMRQVSQGIRRAVPLLSQDAPAAEEAAEAILTSDTHPKQVAVEFTLGRRTVRLGGICKGAGMIQPGMSGTGRRPAASSLHATMLAFLTTDAAVERTTLQSCLEEAVAQSFNRITVDGDMSTNDTVLVLANGRAGNPILARPGIQSGGRRKARKASAGRAPLRDVQTFQAALNHVCLELAKMIVRDGEGVSRFVTVRVSAARSFTEADAAARAVANSALVKTSWCGGDPNWGRIIDALGYSSANVVENKVDIAYSLPGDKKLVCSLNKGQPASTPFRALCRLVAEKEFDLHIRLNLGRAGAVIYAADLTEAYVDFNKGDVSDPASLGG
jgi:glutamate N-acetyltransferase / amino-acid N-acetyltransferase